MGFENIGYAPRNMDTFGSILTTTKNLAHGQRLHFGLNPQRRPARIPNYGLQLCRIAEQVCGEAANRSSFHIRYLVPYQASRSGSRHPACICGACGLALRLFSILLEA